MPAGRQRPATKYPNPMLETDDTENANPATTPSTSAYARVTVEYRGRVVADRSEAAAASVQLSEAFGMRAKYFVRTPGAPSPPGEKVHRSLLLFASAAPTLPLHHFVWLVCGPLCWR